jgi:3-hydroxyisobutyrate dehydrogenase-like beta-hydroxyacid dehydrogenase
MSEGVRVAFLGLGRMGTEMAARLADAYPGLVVWNRTVDVATAFAEKHPSARAARTAADAARQVDVVVCMLADGPAMESALFGPDGAAATLRPGSVVVDMGTSGPASVKRAAELLAAQDISILDAPVSGSVPAARDGTLSVMVGGADEAYALALPILESLARYVVRVGPIGTGAALKLCVNAVLFTLNAGLSEALVVAERAGVDRRAAYGLLLESAVAAPYLRYKEAAFLDPGAAPVAFSLDLVAKDADLATALATGVGAEVPVLQAVVAEVAAARSAGLGSDVMSAVATFLRTQES